ncbi:MAG: HEAT repeat domain-containing protein [Planctomycetota bacterium]|jgi:hypothetical protein
MKIYFCDGCNESIPLADIQAGQVTTIKGKLFCRACIPPGAGVGPASNPPPARRGSSPLLVVGVLALLAYPVWRDLPRLTAAVTGQEEVAGELDQSGERLELDAVAADLVRLRETTAELERRLTFQRGDVESVRASAADLARSLDQLNESIDGLARGQAETGQLIEKLAIQENRDQLLQARIDTLADMVAVLDGRLTEVQVASTAEPEIEVVGPEGMDPSTRTAIDEIRRQLLDPDAGRRFDAVDRVAKGRFKELASDLLPVLDDEDLFVRILAMQVLGDFGYVEAVPALFDVLEDPNAPIRKQAAETLVRLTGYDPEYDHRASQSARDKAVKQWKDWLASR